MTTTRAVANPADLTTIKGFPSISQEAAGLLKMVWRLSEISDDWTKGGSIHPAWDRWTYWPYMAKLTYNLTFAVRMLGKIAQEVPAWREVAASAASKISERMNTYVSIYDWIEQKGLDPNRDKYPYFYYRHTMPWGTGGWYNAPGYAGNGLPVSMPGFFQSIMLAPVEPNPVHPYTYPHSPGVGREYDADPVRAHNSSNMMYRATTSTSWRSAWRSPVTASGGRASSTSSTTTSSGGTTAPRRSPSSSTPTSRRRWTAAAR